MLSRSSQCCSGYKSASLGDTCSVEFTASTDHRLKYIKNSFPIYYSKVKSVLLDHTHTPPPPLSLLSLHYGHVATGLHSLMGSVREATHSILISYSLKHQLSCDGVLQLMSDIRQQLSVQLSPSSKYILVT